MRFQFSPAAFAAVSVVLLSLSVARAHIQPSGPPTLDSAYIVFHVKDDGKDHDSYENVTVTAGKYTIGSLTNAGAGDGWDEQRDTAALYLDNIDRGVEPSDVGKIKVDINHATTRNDDFNFAFTVSLHFTDGTRRVYDHPAKETLTKDNGHGAWEVAKV